MKSNLIKRSICYILGLLFLAFGVTMSIKSNLGVSPVNSIPYMISHITGFDQGILTTIIFCSFIVIQAVLLGKEFKSINLLQIVFSIVFGYFVTFSNNLFSFLIVPQNYLLHLLLLCISIILVALGLLLYLSADIVPQPAEGLFLAIHKKTKIEFSNIKIFGDSSFVIISVILSFVFLGELIGIREGTIISAIMIGKLLGILSHLYKEKLRKFLFS